MKKWCCDTADSWDTLYLSGAGAIDYLSEEMQESGAIFLEPCHDCVIRHGEPANLQAWMLHDFLTYFAREEYQQHSGEGTRL